MATQLKIYETAVPVSLAQHRNCCVELVTNYAFCRALKLGAAHGGGICQRDVGICDRVCWHGGSDTGCCPGRSHRRESVHHAAGRLARLCCASTRRSRVCNQGGRGERLFGEDGKPTPYVENVLKYLQQYQLEFHRTQEFCKKLKDLNLLRPMQAQVDIGAGERLALGGFSVVDRARLKTCRPLCLRS